MQTGRDIKQACDWATQTSRQADTRSTIRTIVTPTTSWILLLPKRRQISLTILKQLKFNIKIRLYRLYLTFRAAAVRFTRGHFYINAGTQGTVALLNSLLSKVGFATFSLLRGPFSTQTIRKRRNISVLIHTAVLIGTPQAWTLSAIATGSSMRTRWFADLVFFHVNFFGSISHL